MRLLSISPSVLYEQLRAGRLRSVTQPVRAPRRNSTKELKTMADGLAWDDLAPELEGPGVGIRRMDADGLAMCLIRLDAGLRTNPRPTCCGGVRAARQTNSRT
jgi:hypothetical protein